MDGFAQDQRQKRGLRRRRAFGSVNGADEGIVQQRRLERARPLLDESGDLPVGGPLRHPPRSDRQ